MLLIHAIGIELTQMDLIGRFFVIMDWLIGGFLLWLPANVGALVH